MEGTLWHLYNENAVRCKGGDGEEREMDGERDEGWERGGRGV